MINYKDIEHNATMIDNNIKSIEKRYTQMAQLLRDCRNELCYHCGEYTSSYLGACSNCRWRDK